MTRVNQRALRPAAQRLVDGNVASVLAAGILLLTRRPDPRPGARAESTYQAWGEQQGLFTRANARPDDL